MSNDPLTAWKDFVDEIGGTVLDETDTALARSTSRTRDDESLSELNRRANRYRTECGCAMGGAFLVAALVAWVAYVVVDGPHDTGHIVRQAFFGVPIVVACSIAGKALGIGVARLKYVVVRSRIRRLRKVEV
ncbi:MAG: hypothetical protein ABI894_03660 [Ilumatobacteraceae bacterium]